MMAKKYQNNRKDAIYRKALGMATGKIKIPDSWKVPGTTLKAKHLLPTGYCGIKIGLGQCLLPIPSYTPHTRDSDHEKEFRIMFEDRRKIQQENYDACRKCGFMDDEAQFIVDCTATVDKHNRSNVWKCLSVWLDDVQSNIDCVIRILDDESLYSDWEPDAVSMDVMGWGRVFIEIGNLFQRYVFKIVSLLESINHAFFRITDDDYVTTPLKTRETARYCLREYCLLAEQAISDLKIKADIQIDRSSIERQREIPVTLQAAKAKTKIPIPTIRNWYKANPPKIRHIKRGSKVYVWVSEVEANI